MKVLSYPAQESVAAAMITILSKSNRRGTRLSKYRALYCPLTIGYYDGIEYFLAYEHKRRYPRE